MEQQNMDQSLFDLNLNENAKTQLRGAAVWAGIGAITGLIGAILSFGSVLLDRMNPRAQTGLEGFGNAQLTAESQGANLFSAIFSLGIGILLFYLLNRFSNLTKSGINGNNQELVNNGLGSLSGYFRTVGILLIIVLFFGVIALLVAAGGGA